MIWSTLSCQPCILIAHRGQTAVNWHLRQKGGHNWIKQDYTKNHWVVMIRKKLEWEFRIGQQGPQQKLNLFLLMISLYQVSFPTWKLNKCIGASVVHNQPVAYHTLQHGEALALLWLVIFMAMTLHSGQMYQDTKLQGCGFESHKRSSFISRSSYNGYIGGTLFRLCG